MSSPNQTGPDRRLRVAGIALLAVAALALVIGLGSLAGGDGGRPSADGGPSAGATSSPGRTSSPGGPTSAPTTAPSGQPGTGQPGAGQPGAAQPGVGQPGAQPGLAQPAPVRPRPGEPGGGSLLDNGGEFGGSEQGVDGTFTARPQLRVYNNSTITGLAARAAQDFRDAGWSVVEVGNYSSGIIPTSTVYFREGTSEQDAAQVVSAEFGLRAESRFPGIRDSSPGLIVIVTNDYGGR